MERRARMEARATELKAKREAERQAFVATQYERQWRLACDPLREQDSQLIVKATTAARAYQIGEKMRQLEREEQESRAFDDLWEKDRLAKLGREEAEASQRMQMDAAQKAVLDRQVAELHAYREMEKDLAEQEAQMMKEQALIEEEESRNVEAHRAPSRAFSLHTQLERTPDPTLGGGLPGSSSDLSGHVVLMADESLIIELRCAEHNRRTGWIGGR